MKIVFLTPAAQAGGAEAALLELMRAVRAARPDWPLHLIAGEDGPLLQKTRYAGVTSEVLAFPDAIRLSGEERFSAGGGWGRKFSRTLRLARGAVWVLFYVRQLRVRFRELKPDLIHSHGMKMHLFASLAEKRTRNAHTPLIWHFQDYLSARPTLAPFLKRLAGKCRTVIANSESVAANARSLLPDTLPIITIYNVIDPEKFRHEGNTLDLDNLAGLPPPPAGTVRVGLIATFARWKGHETFLRAISEFPPNREVRFYVIGGPIYETPGSQWNVEALKKLAGELGVADRVSFTGFVEDAAAAIRTLDIVVHASTEPEPFGLVIIQAMACGRPIISSALGGACELIEPEVDGITFPAGDSKELAAAIERLVNDPELRARLGRAGRTKAPRDFSWGNLARQLLPVYEKLKSA